MADLELIVLGSASGLPEPDRAHASLALHRGEDVWLLDAGEGVCSSLLRCSLEPESVRSIYITHCHPDHCVGIFMLLQYLHMKGFRQKIDIHLPAGAIGAFQTFMIQLYLVPGVFYPPYHLEPLDAEHQLDDYISLYTLPTKHLKRWEELELPGLETRSYAFRIKSPSGSIFYSGDVSGMADIEGYLHPGELLILEASHVDFDSVLSAAQTVGIERILLTHALPEQRHSLADLQFRAAKFGVEIMLARDGLRLSL